jgi:integrative and conjugative element protein (TIGR02256 family)
MVWLDDEARMRIILEATRRRFVETGGPLFGFEAESQDVVVVAALGPGPRAEHRPRSLTPDREATQVAIQRMHDRGRGRYRYVGSWHTHPCGDAIPSERDAVTARDISHQTEVALPRPLLLIQSVRPRVRLVRLGPLAAYRWNAEEYDLVPLDIVNVDDAERTYPMVALDL